MKIERNPTTNVTKDIRGQHTQTNKQNKKWEITLRQHLFL